MLCVIAIIDHDSRDRLLKIQSIGEKFGIAPRHLHGHITLATYLGTEEDRFISSCKDILSGYHTCTVHYEKIQILSATSIIVATPEKISTLTDIQRDISDRWCDKLDRWTRAEVWEPHTTLVHRPGFDLEPVAGAMQEMFEPFSARIDRVEFSRVCDNGYEILETVSLKS